MAAAAAGGAAARAMSLAARKFDVVVYGATGFTGRLVAEYLAKSYTVDKLRFAIAGRSQGSLKKVQQALVPLASREVDMILADSGDAATLHAMVQQTRVVISTVGPFAKYGSNLVAACAATGTSYVDTTGETPWVRAMLEEHDATARRTGALMVPMCGFDSIPSDLGSYYLVDQVRKQLNAGTALVESCVTLKGAASGGTVHSALNLLESAASKRALANPHLLCYPEASALAPAAVTPRTRPAMGLSYQRQVGQWLFPFVMAGVNEQTVRRSAYISAQRPGERYATGLFQYRERQATRSMFKAAMTLLTLAITFLLINLRIVRWAVRKFMPVGRGPSRAAMARGHLNIRMVATTEEAQPRHAFLTINGNSDPGYSLTAQMVAEAGVCIAHGKAKLPGRDGGILTPATGIGMALVNRLNETGLTFTVATGKEAKK